MRILRPLSDVLYRPLTHRNWPRVRKFTQSCWCLHWSLGLRTDVWQMRLQVYTILVVTQVWIEKPFFTSVNERSCHYCAIIEVRRQRPLFRARENRRSTSYNLSFLQSYVQVYVLLDVIRGWRSLGFNNKIPFYFHLGRNYSSDWYSICGKKTGRYRCNECGVASL